VQEIIRRLGVDCVITETSSQLEVLIKAWSCLSY